MSPAALVVLEGMIRFGPAIVRQVQEIFATEKPTQEQWDALFDGAQKSYEAYIEDAKRKSLTP